MSECEKEKSKEVLVVFQNRRAIKFKVTDDPSEDKSSLLWAVRDAFSDVLGGSEGASSTPSSYFFQMESKEWGGLVDATGEADNRSTVFIKPTESLNEVSQR